MSEPKDIFVSVRDWSQPESYSIEKEWPLADFMRDLAAASEEVPPEYRAEATVSIEARSIGSHDSSEVEFQMLVGYWRPETAEEIAAREAEDRRRNQRLAEQIEAQERFMLAGLMAKYWTP